MSVFSLFKKQVEAAKDKKRIVFPESDDLRILTAVSNLNKDGIVEPILIGKKRKCRQNSGRKQFGSYRGKDL